MRQLIVCCDGTWNTAEDRTITNVRRLYNALAEKDENVNPTVVNKLSEQLTTLEKAHQFTIYPGAQHAFFNHLRPEVYDAEASADAWQQLTGWFSQYLGYTEHQLNSDEQLQEYIEQED